MNTPPLKEDTADGKPRGLFFDVSDPQTSESASSTKLSVTEGAVTRHHKERVTKDKEGGKKRREWWDPPLKPTTSSSLTPATATKRRQSTRKAELFEFNVPEHLPTSPMCPAHPKHKSKGKGMCVVSFQPSYSKRQ